MVLAMLSKSKRGPFPCHCCRRMFVAFLLIVAHHPIPKNADDNLMPTRKNEKECINAKTVVQYVGKVIWYWIHIFTMFTF